MRKIFLSFLLSITIFAAKAQQGVYPWLRFKDSLLGYNYLPASLTQPRYSPEIRLGSYVWDTIANANHWTQWHIWNKPLLGGTVSNYYLIFQADNGIVPFSLRYNGDAEFYSSLKLTQLGSNLPAITTNNPVYFGNNAPAGSINWRFTSVSAAAHTAPIFQVDQGTFYNTGILMRFLGNNGRPLLTGIGPGSVGAGTDTPYKKSMLDVNSKGKAFLPPSMSTAQRDGINKFVSNIALTNAGSGYQLTPSVVISASPVGGINATAHAIFSGGIITGIQVDEEGSGYSSAPTITIIPNPTPGFNGGSGATATASVDTVHLRRGCIVYNTDVNKPQYYNDTTWIDWGTGTGSSECTCPEFDSSSLSNRIDNAYNDMYSPNDSMDIFTRPNGQEDTILYTKVFSIPRVTGIDLSIESYSMSTNGLYQIIKGGDNPFIFLDPTTCPVYEVKIYWNGDNGHVYLSSPAGDVLDKTGSIITELPGKGSYEFVPDGTNWIMF